MWPWGHLGVAYIVYWMYSRGRFKRPPRPAAAVGVLLGSQFADLVDKPLAVLGVFPHGRFFFHSLVVTGILIIIVYSVAFLLDRVEVATAFILAHLSHLLADVPPRVALGYPFGTEFLFWPFISYPTFRYHDRLFEAPPAIEFLVTPLTDPMTFFLIEFALFGLAIGLWYQDGCPGMELIADRFSTNPPC